MKNEQITINYKSMSPYVYKERISEEVKVIAFVGFIKQQYLKDKSKDNSNPITKLINGVGNYYNKYNKPIEADEFIKKVLEASYTLGIEEVNAIVALLKKVPIYISTGIDYNIGKAKQEDPNVTIRNGSIVCSSTINIEWHMSEDKKLTMNNLPASSERFTLEPTSSVKPQKDNMATQTLVDNNALLNLSSFSGSDIEDDFYHFNKTVVSIPPNDQPPKESSQYINLNDTISDKSGKSVLSAEINNNKEAINSKDYEVIDSEDYIEVISEDDDMEETSTLKKNTTKVDLAGSNHDDGYEVIY